MPLSLIVYHGSTDCIPEPRLLASSRRLDFGAGFYVTSSLDQAQRWALIKQRRLRTSRAYVSVYDASGAFAATHLCSRTFDSPSEDWLDFVMINRMGADASIDKWDLVRGPVANDTLYETLSLFERGILTKPETIARLKTHRLADQTVFASEQSLAMLSFVECREVVE